MCKIKNFCSFFFRGVRYQLAFVSCYEIFLDDDDLEFFDIQPGSGRSRCVHVCDIGVPVAYGVKSPDYPHLRHVLYPTPSLFDPKREC